MLIPLTRPAWVAGPRGSRTGAQVEDSYLVVHPNFVADEGF